MSIMKENRREKYLRKRFTICNYYKTAERHMNPHIAIINPRLTITDCKIKCRGRNSLTFYFHVHLGTEEYTKGFGALCTQTSKNPIHNHSCGKRSKGHNLVDNFSPLFLNRNTYFSIEPLQTLHSKPSISILMTTVSSWMKSIRSPRVTNQTTNIRIKYIRPTGSLIRQPTLELRTLDPQGH